MLGTNLYQVEHEDNTFGGRAENRSKRAHSRSNILGLRDGSGMRSLTWAFAPHLVLPLARALVHPTFVGFSGLISTEGSRDESVLPRKIESKKLSRRTEARW